MDIRLYSDFLKRNKLELSYFIHIMFSLFCIIKFFMDRAINYYSYFSCYLKINYRRNHPIFIFFK